MFHSAASGTPVHDRPPAERKVDLMSASSPCVPTELEEQIRFENLITEVSTRFIHLLPEHVDAEIESAMQKVSECLGIDRCSLAKYEESDAKFHITHRWASSGIALLPDLTPHEQIPWIAQQILGGSFVQFSNLNDFPKEAATDRETTRSIVQAKSGTIIPLSAGGRVFGAIAFDAMTCEKQWSSKITERLQLIAQVFANALARKHTTEQLLMSEEKLRLAVDSAQLGVWEWRFDQKEVWSSAQNNLLTGLPAGETLTFDFFMNSVHPEDRESVAEVVRQVKQDPIEFRLEYRVIRPNGQTRWLVTRGRSYTNGGEKPERVTGISVDVTQRKNAERELAERARLGKILPDLSATFVNLKAEAVHAEIEFAQKRLCETLGFDRSTLFQLAPGGKQLRATHCWAGPGFQAVHGKSSMDAPWATQELLAGRSFHFSKVDDLPESAATDKESILRNGPKSCALFPLTAGGEVLGVLTFGTIQAEREWPNYLLDALQLVSQVFANAIARKQYDERLQNAYSEIKSLKDKLESENFYLREEIKLEHQHHEVIGQCEAIRRVLRSAEQVAATDSTVLLQGETGTGKELIARAIHDLSRRKDRPMVKVNCAALPATLVESELFGRERGAYTGALTREMGRFEVANGSTLFLDEIGELPLELQAKLLRALQEGEFERLGSSKTIKVDVRVIVATARDLKAMVKEGKFREDLFYRVSVFPVHIPPLRERKEDIPMLVWHFVREIGRRMGRNIEDVRASTIKSFQSYSWPGNVRELRNVIERHLITNPGPIFQADLSGLEPSSTEERKTLESVEQSHIAKVLRSTGGRIRGRGGAAEILGMKPSTLESRMKKLGVSRHA
jgi:PAS domain S-box-containing protein